MGQFYLRDYGFYRKCARFWWGFLDDLDQWKWMILSCWPGKVGVFMRSKMLVKQFGACGESPIILPLINVDNPKRLYIGDYFRCSRDLYISAGGTVIIGDNVGIGPSVKIWSINHNYDQVDVPIYDQGWSKKKVIIEDDCWIGANCFIMPGVCIGRGSILSAGSVLSKSIKPFSIVAGNPGRIIGYRIDKDMSTKATSEKA